MSDRSQPKPKKRERGPRKEMSRGKPMERGKPMDRGKGPNRVRPSGKQSYSAAQRARRKAEDTLYRRVTRPTYLMDLARAQGRLTRREDDIYGDTPQFKLQALLPDELPLCEMALAQTDCHGHRAAVHVHHRKGRGPYLNDPETYVGACPACHDYVETNRAWARREGHLETRHARVSEEREDG